MTRTAVAEARTNIALIKYWGKVPGAGNLPAVPSLSLTLDGLTTRTQVTLDAGLAADQLILNEQPQQGVALERVRRHLDLIAGSRRPRALVHSTNSFPTAAGLASSASAFAALTLAAAAAAGQSHDPGTLSILARQGSGSAARSIFGGLVVLGAGTPGQVASAFAAPLPVWDDLRLVIGVVSEAPKDTPSTDGMKHTAATSPYYGPWCAGAPADLHAALQAVERRSLEELGAAAERSALRMHASALAADPGVVYLRGPTIEGLHGARLLRQAGCPAWFTCDAGPHPKVLTDAAHAQRVADALGAVPGVLRTIIAGPGSGAQVLEVTP